MSSGEVITYLQARQTRDALQRLQTNDTTTGGTHHQIHGEEDRPCSQFGVPIPLAVTCGVDIPSNESSNDDRLPKRFLSSITTLLAHFFALCTHNEALRAATSDSDVDQVTENLKSEWVKVGRWLLALATLDVSLLTIGAKPMFKIDEVAQDLIALSAVATGLGMLCCAWFLVRFLHLQRWDFMDRARDTNGSYTYFALSSELPLVGLLVSMMSLMAFSGRIVYNTLPTFALLMGSACFGIIMALRFIVRGGRVLYSFISTTHSALSRWFINCLGTMQVRRDAGVGNGSGLQV
ncbi:hypothetical protein GGX14DRAFT_604629 [Mycena pura]|uniref:Transmembrane protein n=1 Tax=Mycena pura TaxID=153505 RepID=A0AAD6VQB0_9AGAR|nr:hypothetical protein GGX14DRAFT_604629 [Mycena pura]